MKKLLVAALLGAFTLPAMAIDWNKILPKEDLKTMRYGMATSLGLFKPAEAEGDTSMAPDLVFFNAVATMRYKKKGRRLWFDASYQYFETDASESEIGQQVGRYKALVSWQKFVKLGEMKFWAGGGGGLMIEQADSRHTVDSAGFLKEDFGNRTTVDGMAVGNVQMPLFKFVAGIPVELGVHAQLELPVQTVSPSVVFGANFLF